MFLLNLQYNLNYLQLFVDHLYYFFFFFQAEDGIRDGRVTGVQTCALPISRIDGRDVAVCVNDFTVKGASTSATNGKKLGHLRRTATEKGMAFVHIGESTEIGRASCRERV